MIKHVPLEVDFDESAVPIKYCQNSSAPGAFEIRREKGVQDSFNKDASLVEKKTLETMS